MANADFSIMTLGNPVYPSPLHCCSAATHATPAYVDNTERIVWNPRADHISRIFDEGSIPESFEIAGPREKIFFNPAQTKAAIVSCGGICPGINDVIRELVMILHYQYQIPSIIGYRYGFSGIADPVTYQPLVLKPETVSFIHSLGGTILGSSRGAQDIDTMIQTLIKDEINILFCIGGDGTFHGAYHLSERVRAQGRSIAVVAIPKTIDNDIMYVEKTFGFDTAVAVSLEVLRAAHVEATGAYNGIGLVKLMGRHSGCITAYAALASNDVNLVLIPEQPFSLDGDRGILPFIEKRLAQRHHALIVVAEGAGQELIQQERPAAQHSGTDASGNIILEDIGLFLKEKIKQYCKQHAVPVTVKYIDPSYTVRSVPASAADSIFCTRLAQMAAHAGMAGKTTLMIGTCHGLFTHVPLKCAIAQRKIVSPQSDLWRSVIEATGQPASFV